MYRRILSALLGAALLTTGIVVAQSGGYLNTFDGAPATPMPYPTVAPLGAMDVTLHSRNDDTWTALQAMDAAHGTNCGAPPATHPLTGTYSDYVFQCNNHVMTSLYAEGYGVIYLTPPVVADWSAGPATIQWDLSTLRTSARDWVDLWVTPYGEHLQLPLDAFLPDLSGKPQDTVHAEMGNFANGTNFSVFCNSSFTTDCSPGSAYWETYDQVLIPSAARRDTFQLVLSATHVKLWMPAYNLVWVDGDFTTPLTWTQGVIQFGHHSYNPQKDCDPSSPCQPNTWHWDNVSVSPGLPFTITRATTAYLDAGTSSTVTFPTPAEDGAHLQFAAVSNAVEYSLDGGTTWTTAPTQTAELSVASTSDKAHGYWVAVPAGTTTVNLRGHNGWWGGWYLRDFSLWGQVQGHPFHTPTPTPVATSTPTRTPTPTPNATATTGPSPTPPPTATPLPTPTPLPSPTPSPTAAPTATPRPGTHCARVDIVTESLVWSPLPDVECMQ